MLNSATQLAITKLDVRFPECAGVKSFNDLSDEAKSFIKNIEGTLSLYHIQERGYCFGIQFS